MCFFRYPEDGGNEHGLHVAIWGSTRKVRPVLLLSMAMLLFAGPGCIRHQYEIQMEPQGSQLHRRLSGSQTQEAPGTKSPVSPLPAKEQDHLARVYGAEPAESKERETVIAGTFAGRLPADIGGEGRYLHWETSLGSASFYLERFRGDDDLSGRLEQHFAAIDEAVDLLKGWVVAARRPESEIDRIQLFLDTDLRRDLKNLFLHLWSLEANGSLDRDGESELIARTVQYLFERQYVIEQELPRYLRTIQNEEGIAIFHLVVESLNRKLDFGDSDSLAQRLPPLSDSDRFTASMEAYIGSTERYHVWKERSLLAGVEADDTNPTDFMTSLLYRIAPFFALSGYDGLSVRLKLAEKPYITNGEWSDEKGVEWSTTLEVPGQAVRNILPSVLFAGWSQPNVEEQREHFGRVILVEKELAEYVGWQRGLTKSEVREWDTFLNSIRPTDDVVERVRAFRFSDEPVEFSEGKRSLSETPARCLQAGLGASS